MSEINNVLDVQRIFIGQQPPLYLIEVLFRVFIMYYWAVFMLSLMGKRGRSQMTPLEYIIIIALGSATGDAMFYPQVPLLYAMGTVSFIILMGQSLAYLKQYLPILRKFTETKPVVLVKKGKLIEKNINSQTMDEEELKAHLREEGISDVSQVLLAVFEITGKLSVFKIKDYKREKQGKLLEQFL